jgi:phosphoglucosamine mutase
MAKRLFGTDGIRGVAGEFPLDRKTVYAFGLALGHWAEQEAAGSGVAPKVLLGMDTRESGPWIAEHVAGGLREHGVEPRFAGLITTPGVAWLTRTSDFIAGVMISASHNPFHDNGLKVFDHSGFKLPDSTEIRLEEDILSFAARALELKPVALTADPGLDHEYLAFLASTFQGSMAGRRIVLDCAHGAASALGPDLFRQLGAEVIVTGASPNGRNINDGVGALHTEALREHVLAHQADAGVAFDGDADRVMIISRSGKLIDGDHMLLIAARRLQATGHLPNPVVVATVMSNLGLERALAKDGIAMVRTAVGDKYVLEEMVKRDAPVGGEQSGHVIFREWATTGDGLLTALRVLETVQATGQPLDELTADFKIYPQLLVNVKVKEKRPLDQLTDVRSEIAKCEAAFRGAGRVLVRFSGTEPLARVMVEGDDTDQVKIWAHRIADVLKVELEG